MFCKGKLKLYKLNRQRETLLASVKKMECRFSPIFILIWKCWLAVSTDEDHLRDSNIFS